MRGPPYLLPPGTRICLAVLALGLGSAPRLLNAQSEPPTVHRGPAALKEFGPFTVKQPEDFPSRPEWVRFWATLNSAMQSNSIDSLAALHPEVKVAASRLLSSEADRPFGEWLVGRLDFFEAAAEYLAQEKSLQDQPAPGDLYHYRIWTDRISRRPASPRTAQLVQQLKEVFRQEGVPEELVWLAEVESSFNSTALSPVGALGLFQFMPDAARRFGLRLQPFDERKHPHKSARAAARYLRVLYREFSSWPLSLAAYNAGEGRVRRLLRAESAQDFTGIVWLLPAETRLYVPKVLATVAVRESLNPEDLPPPSAAGGAD